jgi:Ca2+-binding RTX toxin-like protein
MALDTFDVTVSVSSGKTITGTAANDVLSGGPGNDSINGGAGADSMAGGAGNDLYVVDNAGDVVRENANEGIDTVQSSVSYALPANAEILTLLGNAAINGTRQRSQ